MKKLFNFLTCLITIIVISSCKSVGPGTMNNDRNAYLNAISDSWKKQLLLNMVKIRYVDVLVMLDVSSIISQYEVSGQFNAGTSIEQNGIGWNPSIGAQANFTDRPTISYEPKSGEKFAMSLMKPLPIRVILGLVYAGYPVDRIFMLTVNSINGIKNSFAGPTRRHPASPKFYGLLDAFAKIQGKDGIDIASRKITETKEELFIEINDSKDTVLNEAVRVINQVLGIPDTVKEYKIGIGSKKDESLDFAIMTRSILEILLDVGAYIHAPIEHISGKEVFPEPDFLMPDGTPVKPFLNIYSGKEEPMNSFVSIYYNGYWFYIEKDDYSSKAMFSFLLLITSMVESNDKEVPVITIPTR